MKYALIFVLIIFSRVSNAQRLEKIDKVDLVNFFKEDINFWSYAPFGNLENPKLIVTKYTKLSEIEWSQTNISGNEISYLIRQKSKIEVYDSLGNTMGFRDMEREPTPSVFIAVSENPELRNKIGFGFQTYTGLGEMMPEFILFTDINNWPNLKDKRKTSFLKLLSDFPQYPKVDSVINIKINDRDSKLHLFNLGVNNSDSFPALSTLADILLKGYEKDFGSVYYSGKDSSYEITYDQYGNSKMKKGKTNENISKVNNTNEQSNTQNKESSSFKISEICLLFEKQIVGQNVRKIYPGVSTPSTNSLGNGQEINNLYLSPLTLKRFSSKSQTLIDYLIQIYN